MKLQQTTQHGGPIRLQKIPADDVKRVQVSRDWF